MSIVFPYTTASPSSPKSGCEPEERGPVPNCRPIRIMRPHDILPGLQATTDSVQKSLRLHWHNGVQQGSRDPQRFPDGAKRERSVASIRVCSQPGSPGCYVLIGFLDEPNDVGQSYIELPDFDVPLNVIHEHL